MVQPKIFEEFQIDFELIDSSREALRFKIINKFLKEKPGYWKDNVQHPTRYKYFVETLSDGRRIYLKRPTHLNKGLDFQVTVEKLQGNEDKRPSFDDILTDLEAKKRNKPTKTFATVCRQAKKYAQKDTSWQGGRGK